MVGIVVEENVADYGRKQGLFVLVQSGESVIPANPPEFVPCLWWRRTGIPNINRHKPFHMEKPPMPTTITFEDVWKMFQETNRQFQETKQMFQETDRKFQETDRKFQETDRKFQETDRQFQETKQIFQETERIVKDVSRQVGNLTGKWGQFVEEMVAPACKWLFAQWGIPTNEVHQRVTRLLDNGQQMDIDLLVANTNTVVLVDVKSTLGREDAREHLERLANFKKFFPRYADCRVVGAVAGLVVEKNAASYARKKGLFVMVQSGESVVLANPPEFTPRAW